MNVFNFSGRIGQQPELRTTQSGEKVLSFSVANSTGFGDRKKTQWIECSYWGSRGEAVAKFLNKGDMIPVSGELTLVEFTRKDGTPGSKLAVRVNDLDLPARSEGGSSQREEGGGGYDQSVNSRSAGGGQRGGGKPAFDQDLDDSIPF